MASDKKDDDISDTLEMVEKAEQVDDGDIEIAADDGGGTAMLQKMRKVMEEEEENGDSPPSGSPLPR